MTLEEAICQLQEALIKTKRPKGKQAGLKVGEATAELSLGLKGTGMVEAGGKLTLGIVEWGPKASYTRERTAGNTLTVKFVPSEDGPYLYKFFGADGKPIQATQVLTFMGVDGKPITAQLNLKEEQAPTETTNTSETDYCAQLAVKKQ